ncbi:MAG: hypothetical protein SF052_04515 [Bacteroidia bacterium]|nr:hypothetical protein [Bacteroidia bacterium]
MFLLPAFASAQPGEVNPYLLTTHPLGMWVSRINPNFQSQPVSEKEIRFGFSGGNVWLPPVAGYIPADPEVRAQMEKLIWYHRNHVFLRQPIAADRLYFAADGILREFRAQYLLPLPRSQQLSLGFRAYFLGGGKPPFSLLISDGFIEWFHSYVAGGEDPFARKVYGFNRAGFHFRDEKGHNYRMEAGDIVFPGLELDYHWFPVIRRNRLGVIANMGIHLGVNTSRYNVSFDPGASFAATRAFLWEKGHKLKISAGISVLYPGVFGNPAPVRFITAKRIHTLSWEINYRKTLDEKTALSVGLYYYCQSPYRQRSEYKSLVLYGPEISSHWHYALSHLYKSAENWSLYFTVEKKRYNFSVYIREDFKVNNAPDMQTGIQFSLPLSSASRTVSAPVRGF